MPIADRKVMGIFPGDARVRSAHGVAAVRRLTRVSNDIAVPPPRVRRNARTVMERSVVGLSCESVDSAEEIGGCVETRLKRDEPSPRGRFTMSFTQRSSPQSLRLDVHALEVDTDKDDACSERNRFGCRRLRRVMLAPPSNRLILAPRHSINRLE